MNKVALLQFATASAIDRSISNIKRLRAVSVVFKYTDKDDPNKLCEKEYELDFHKITNRVSQAKFLSLFTNRDQPRIEEEQPMAAYKYEVIWLNEMGEEQRTLHEDEQGRNTAMQALADDGYSPVFREI